MDTGKKCTAKLERTNMNLAYFKKELIVIGTLVVGALIVLGFLVSKSNVKGKVLCFGDSITHGAFVEGARLGGADRQNKFRC